MNNKIETISNLFEGNEIRSIWDSEKEEYYFSVVDIIGALTGSKEPRKYWSVLKNRLKKEGSELTTNCSQLKMLVPDGKIRLRDVMITRDIFRLIESVPSPKAEPFKLWLANLGSERIDEVFDPEIAVNRAITYYRNKGYTDEWIKRRLTGIVDRLKLTDVWREGGITKPIEYAMLTNEIYKVWSGMKSSEYKAYKGLRKENLKVAARGGSVAKGARDLYEKETKRKAISEKNALNYKYIDEQKQIGDKEGKKDE